MHVCWQFRAPDRLKNVNTLDAAGGVFAMTVRRLPPAEAPRSSTNVRIMAVRAIAEEHRQWAATSVLGTHGEVRRSHFPLALSCVRRGTHDSAPCLEPTLLLAAWERDLPARGNSSAGVRSCSGISQHRKTPRRLLAPVPHLTPVRPCLNRREAPACLCTCFFRRIGLRRHLRVHRLDSWC